MDALDALPAFDTTVDSEADSNVFSGLIGIYTLTEGAGLRAKRLLESMYPQARVETNKDHEATERLTTLARKADVFVFAWKSSKHQAYFCIKNARSTRDILMPLGKGSASIVMSVNEYMNMN